MTKCRILADYNASPICGPNPLWVDDGHATDPDAHGQFHWLRRTPLSEYAFNSLNFQKSYMCYDGSLNMAASWANPDLTLKNLTYDAQRKLYNVEQQFYGSFSNPPQELQVKMCAALTNIENPFPLDGSKSPRYMPMVFDLENPSVMSDAARVQNMTNALRWAKSLKADSPVFSFAWPDHTNTQEAYDSGGWKEFADATDYLSCGEYFWDCPTANPNVWFDEMEGQLKLLDRFYKHIPRIAFMCPLYQIYFQNHNSAWVNAKNNQPVDPVFWKKALQWLVDHDMDMFIWLGGTPLNAQTQNLLQIANTFQR